MTRFLLALVFASAAAVAATPAGKSPERVIGTVQPEIRLADGTIFTSARVLGVTLDRHTATISDGMRIRIVSLDALPEPLRTQVITEARRGDAPPYNIYREEVRPPRPPERPTLPPPPDADTRAAETVEPTPGQLPHYAPAPRFNAYREEVRPPPPPDKSMPPPATVTGATPTTMDHLVSQAIAVAPNELNLELLKRGERVASLTTRIRKAGQVPSWQKIRVEGDAAFSWWDHSRRDYVWRTEKFEVDFTIVDGVALKPDRISFGGISRQLEIDY